MRHSRFFGIDRFAVRNERQRASASEITACLWNSGPREPSKAGSTGGGQRRGFGPPDWTGQELTSSWLAVYLGSYFDRRYHCERGDKLS